MSDPPEFLKHLEAAIESIEKATDCVEFGGERPLGLSEHGVPAFVDFYRGLCRSMKAAIDVYRNGLPPSTTVPEFRRDQARSPPN
jgi:hypothetical protein